MPSIPIAPIIGIPICKAITDVHLKLKLNTASVHFVLGNGVLGLIALMRIMAVYLTLAGVSFIPLGNPGQIFVIPPGSRGFQITALDQAHETRVRVWKEFLER